MKPGKFLVMLIIIACILAGCGFPQSRIDPKNLESRRKTSFDHFGTACFAVVFDDFSSTAAAERFESAWQEIDAMLSEMEKSVGVDTAGSDVYRFNQAKCGESVAINPITAGIAGQAMEMYKFTGGAFNPAVANLVDLWGFSPRFRKSGTAAMPYDRPRKDDGSFDLPDRRYVEAFKKLSDFSGVALSGNKTSGYRLVKNVKDIVIDGVVHSLKIDFGGIAKGYGADRAAEILEKRGYEYGYVNLGLSSLRLLKRNVSDKGAPSANMWAVSMSNPDKRSENYLTAFGRDTGVSTSGTYDVHYFIDGREYSHIIDANSGEPTSSDIVSVTVLGKNAGSDDALSTALCVMGKEKARDFMNARLKEYRVAMLVRNKNKLELVTNMDDKEYALSPPQ